MNIPSVDLLKALQKWGVRDVREEGVNREGGGVGVGDGNERDAKHVR